jgi:hypothetical protein
LTWRILFCSEILLGNREGVQFCCLYIISLSILDKNFKWQFSDNWRPTKRSGGNTHLLRKRSRVRFPHNANICVHEHVCLYWVWVFLCNICIYKKNEYNPSSRFHNTSLISAYFGLDSCECKYLEYYLLLNTRHINKFYISFGFVIEFTS